MLVSTILNAILDPLFIHFIGFHGAAIATLLSQVICLLFMLSTTAFLYIVLKWDLWICIGCGILLGVGGFHFGSNSSSSKND